MSIASPTIVYGFSNIEIAKQILVGETVLTGLSRAGQTISVYHGDTLVADCVMPSTGSEQMPTVLVGTPTAHDETFSGFVDGETYTIVAGDESPITGFVVNGNLASFDVSSLFAVVWIAGNSWNGLDCTGNHHNFSVSQKVQTTRKKYDIKLLPEELLPKTVAKKTDVLKAQKLANGAQSTANSAQSTANSAKSAAMNTFWQFSPAKITNMFISDGEAATLNDRHLIVGEQYWTGTNGTANPNDPVWDGKSITIDKATIAWDAQKGVYRISGAGQAYSINGRFIYAPSDSHPGATLPPYIVFPNIPIASQSENSTRKFKITVDDDSNVCIGSKKLATEDYVDSKIPSESGSAVQPDWSQNDETAADYVKNRPGGYSKFEDGTPVTRTVTCTTAITGGFKSASTMDNLWRNALGTGASMARVTYDGVDYVVEINGSYALVGDQALEKYPFALNVSEYLGGGAYYYYDYAKTEGTHEITVTPIEETVVPIPEKYMSSVAHETFPDTKIDTIKARYQLEDSYGLVFRVYGGSFAPTLSVSNRQWSFGGIPLIICKDVTFESTLNNNEFFTGIVFKHSGSSTTYFGVTVDMTSNQINPTIGLRKISEMLGS